MAVVPTCPRCRGVLAGTGQRERCPRCGEFVVAVARKLCARCGTDVSNSRRIKDGAGAYYCEPCWVEACEAGGMVPAYPCADCGGWFTAEHVYRRKYSYICTGCYDLATSDGTPGDLAEGVLVALAAAEESSGFPDSPGPTESTDSPEYAASAAAAYSPSPDTSGAAARAAAAAAQERTTWLVLVSAIAAAVLLVLVLVVWVASRH